MFNSTNGWGIMFSNVGTTSRHTVHLASVVVLLYLVQLQFSACLPLDQFYPFNVDNITGDTRTEPIDDGGSGLINLTINFPFFGKSDYRQLYVNNNGIITFLEKLQTYKPINFNSETFTGKIPLIAPFWADIDIENVQDKVLNEAVVYRITNDSLVLSNATLDVRNNFIGSSTFSAKLVIIVTWYNVGFYGASGDAAKKKRNTFQAVLITDGEKSFAIYNYNKIVWTTGSNSGGEVETGLWGQGPAVVGFHSGNVSYYLQEDSGTDAIVTISSTSNVGEGGKYIFRIDGKNIDDRECLFNDKIILTPTVISMLGGEAIRITGPCLNSEFTVKARIKELNLEFPCQVTSDGAVVCVTTSTFRTGEFTFELDPYGEGWEFSAAIYSEHILSVPVMLVRESVDAWQEGKMVTAKWDTADNVPNHIVKTLEVMAYTIVDRVPSFSTLLNVSVGVGKTSRRFRLPTDLSQHKTLVTRLCWTKEEHLKTLPVCIWSDVFPVRWNSQNSKESEDWCERWLNVERTRPEIDIKPPYCPCILTIAKNDFGHFQTDPICDISKNSVNTTCIYNKYAHQCFRRNIKSAEDSGETCCYTSKGELMDIREYSGAGTHERYHYKAQGDDIVPYFSYFESDLLPRLHCCQFSSRNCSDFKDYRNATTCKGYSPPSPAQAAGDPHIVTLDGKGYSFNGVGDFYLVRHIQSTCVIQVRAVRTVDDKGDLQNATVFSHVAVAMPGSSDIVEVRKKDDGSSEVLVNNHILTTSTSQHKNISLVHNDDGSYVIVLEPVSVSVTVSVTPDLLNIIVLIGEDSFKGNIRGLLGNYNGDASDEFVARNGTIISSSATERVIHYDFGMSWQVPQDESILSQAAPIQEDTIAYEPMFIDESTGSLRPGTEQLCGDNLQCIFDFQVTGKESVAKSTVEFTNKFEALKKELDQTVIRCPYLEQQQNGNRTVTGYANGSVATFTCYTGYEMVQGLSRRVCLEDSTWSGTEVVCARNIADESGQTNITLVIYIVSGSAVLVVIAIIISSVIYFCKRARVAKQDTSTQDVELSVFETPHTSDMPGPVFENPSFMQSLQVLFKDGGFRIPRPNYVDPNIFQEYF